MCIRDSAYTAQLDQTAFVVSELNYDATLRNLELIGEAATHIPDAVRAVSYTHLDVYKRQCFTCAAETGRSATRR